MLGRQGSRNDYQHGGEENLVEAVNRHQVGTDNASWERQHEQSSGSQTEEDREREQE
jgi:hypothetical protein